jgi:acyl carrier protein
LDRDEVKTEVRDAMREVFNRDDLEINDDMTADDIEEWDSMEHITLIFSLENRFGIKFKTEEIGGIQNVGEFINVISAKLT